MEYPTPSHLSHAYSLTMQQTIYIFSYTTSVSIFFDRTYSKIQYQRTRQFYTYKLFTITPKKYYVEIIFLYFNIKGGFVKKLFFIISLLCTSYGVQTLSMEHTPVSSQEYQSSSPSIQTNFKILLLYLTMRIQTTFNYGINYIKSFFSPAKLATPNITTKNIIIKEQPQNAEKALAIVAQDLAMVQQRKNIGAIEEVDSPAIQKEKLTSLVKHVQELDMIIAQLPATEWPMWQEKQAKLLAPAAPALKNMIQQNIKNSWREHGTAILTLAIQATGMGVTGALGVFASQYTKIATGNLATLDTDALLISFLTYASAHLISASNTLLTTNTALQSTLTAAETNVLYQAMISPSMQAKNYQLKMPLFRGVIDSLIMNEAYALMNTMLQQNGEIAQTIKNINLKQILFGKKASSPSNMFVTLALPKVKNVLNNKKLALALTEVGWIFFQSATLGGLFWAAGLGYANTPITESIGNAVLTGMAQGVVANVAALANKTTPGAILSISSVPLSQQMVSMTGVNISITPQYIITGVLQAIGTEATNFIIDESEKSGGLLEVLKKGKDALGSAISSRWSDIWGNVTEAWDTIQDIEPLPL